MAVSKSLSKRLALFLSLFVALVLLMAAASVPSVHAVADASGSAGSAGSAGSEGGDGGAKYAYHDDGSHDAKPQGWQKEDFELFDLQAALRKIDPKLDFYSVLELPRTASEREINKAYRRMSLAYHPDKTDNPKHRKLSTLLTNIATILKEDESRARYDGHLKRGFPAKGRLGYYYERYRPGVFMVFVILLLVVSVAQYITSWVFYYRRKQEVAAEIAELNTMSVMQLKKHLQRTFKETEAFNKRALKTATESPFQILLASGEISKADYEVREPALSDTAIVQVPLWIAATVPKIPAILSGKAAKEAADATAAEASAEQADASEPAAAASAARTSTASATAASKKKSRRRADE
ncbi:hypothetical protein BC831DRAFT_412996 [Entophlyctis helioformis]|nr:hypothetical protein BC831DRAFT_412996 [Entophlyctis helioformis]